MKKITVLLLVVFALVAVSAPIAEAKHATSPAIVLNVNDPGDGGSGYPWNTGQCAYHLGNLSSWLSGGYGNGWGYWCDSNGLISYWSQSGGWQYLGWD